MEHVDQCWGQILLVFFLFYVRKEKHTKHVFKHPSNPKSFFVVFCYAFCAYGDCFSTFFCLFVFCTRSDSCSHNSVPPYDDTVLIQHNCVITVKTRVSFAVRLAGAGRLGFVFGCLLHVHDRWCHWTACGGYDTLVHGNSKSHDTAKSDAIPWAQL